MKKVLIIIAVLLMAAPALGRSKKSQAKIDARHAQAVAASQANLNNARAKSINQRTYDRRINNMQERGYRQSERARENGARYRQEKRTRSHQYTGW